MTERGEWNSPDDYFNINNFYDGLLEDGLSKDQAILRTVDNFSLRGTNIGIKILKKLSPNPTEEPQNPQRPRS